MKTPPMSDVKLAELQNVRQITLIEADEQEFLLELHLGVLTDGQKLITWNKTQPNSHFLPLTDMTQVKLIIFFLQIITEQEFIPGNQPTANVWIWRREDEDLVHRTWIESQNQQARTKVERQASPS